MTGRFLPGWIRGFAEVQPSTPAVDLLRHLLLGTPSVRAVWLELVNLAGFCAALMSISVRVLSAAVAVSRRRGTLMEY
jgi:ABC-type multidrug transport system permease subunit